MDVLRRGLLVLATVSLMGGCVFSDRCVGGATRDEASGRCVLGDGGGVTDGGLRDGALPDGSVEDGGGDEDGGIDAGPPPRIVEVSVGVVHACALDDRGVLRCWGDNRSGALGSGDTAPFDAPRVVDLGARVTTVGGTALHTCATTSTPSLFCWGQDMEGQIGDGEASGTPTTSPFEHPGLGSLNQVAGGFANTCTVGLLGGVVCWGRNDRRQLGNDATEMIQPSPGDPMLAPMGGDFEGARQAAIADRHICVRADGRVFCVGDGGEGSLGDGTFMDRTRPTEVTGLTGVTDIAASFAHTCAVASGEVFCWGDGANGQVAPGFTAVQGAPVSVSLPAAAQQVVTGEKHSCALLTDGTVHCWGTDDGGALGDAATHSGPAGPVQVEGLTDVASLSASFVGLTCALTDAAELWCWGQDAIELLGGPMAGANTVFLDGETQHDTPVRVDPL